MIAIPHPAKIIPIVVLILAFMLSACGAESPPTSVPLAPTSSPTPTPISTATPTPIPAIMLTPPVSYTAPNNAFSLEVPAGWRMTELGSSLQFQKGEFDPTRIVTYFEPVPVTQDPDEFVSRIMTDTFTVVQSNDEGDFLLVTNEKTPEGHHRVEYLGKLEPDQPLARVRGELWLESGMVVGVSLSAPADEWDQVEPYWPLLLKSYKLLDLEQARDNLQLEYIHPSGKFTVTVPVNWNVVSEDEGEVLFSDYDNYAQFYVSVTELDHRPQPKELAEALTAALGDLPEQEGYEELAAEAISPLEHMIRFESLTDDDGFYRTELRAFGGGKLLYVTSFSAPPYDWDLFAPAYEKMLGSIQQQSGMPPDEVTQDADLTAGIVAGTPMFYIGNDGNLWVSASIYNNRTRNVGKMTLVTNLYDANGEFLGAESQLFPQRVIGAGETTYMTQKLSPKVTPIEDVASVVVDVFDARDTTEGPYQPWGYEGGTATIDDEGNIKLVVNMRNASNDNRRSIYLITLLYDSEGDLVFAYADAGRLRRRVSPGKTIELKYTVPGPISELASFDVIGEVPTR